MYECLSDEQVAPCLVACVNGTVLEKTKTRKALYKYSPFTFTCVSDWEKRDEFGCLVEVEKAM